MYGYVRPDRGELKVREYEQYRGVYCGLCHTLRRRYGPVYRFAVSYDMTFLAMLLAGPGDVPCGKRRCPYHPLRRTECPEANPGTDAAADYSVILAYWKMRDDARDRKGAGALVSRCTAFLMAPAYKKAALTRPGFAEAARTQTEALARTEQAESACLDEAADSFAVLLRAAGEGTEDPDRGRVLGELLYHLGRIVYVLDAADDLEDDVRTGAYNPLRYRFSPAAGKLSPEDEAAVRLSLQHSHNAVCAAYALLDRNPWAGILDNIIYYGLPAVTQSVFSGQWKARKRGRNRL